MPIEPARFVSSDDVARFRGRRRRGAWGESSSGAGRLAPEGGETFGAEAGPGDDVYVTRPKRVGARREAREVRDALTDRRLAAILARGKNDPDFVKQLARTYRAKYPGLGSKMTDQEIVTVAVEQANKLATERIFKKIGRGVHQ